MQSFPLLARYQYFGISHLASIFFFFPVLRYFFLSCPTDDYLYHNEFCISLSFQGYDRGHFLHQLSLLYCLEFKSVNLAKILEYPWVGRKVNLRNKMSSCGNFFLMWFWKSNSRWARLIKQRLLYICLIRKRHLSNTYSNLLLDPQNNALIL